MNDNESQPEDFLTVQVLGAHQWRPLTAECGCGWTLKYNTSTGRRGARLNHPRHVAGMLREAGVLT